jgi:hypothetical protein
MAITVNTKNPNGLLTAIKLAIQESRVTTWSYDDAGDFTHVPDQWKHKAWLRPRAGEGRLLFVILPPKGKVVTKEVYGVYHGRFIEMLLAHFDKDFSQAVASALAGSGDVVKG